MDEEKDFENPNPLTQGETQYGQVEIADSVIFDLVNVALNRIEEIVKEPKNVKRAVNIDRKNGENIVNVNVNIKLYLTKSIKAVAEKIQSTIKEEVEGMTGLIKVENVSINVLDVEIPPRQEPDIIPDDEIVPETYKGELDEN